MTSLLDVDGRLAGVILALRDASRPVDESAGDPAASRPPDTDAVSRAPALPPAWRAIPLDQCAPSSTISRSSKRWSGTCRPRSAQHRLDELSFVVLDVETTGLRPDAGDRIVSLAGVRVRAGTVRAGEIFDALVCPERPIPAASTRFHGITDAMVVEAPVIGVVLPAFLRFAEGAVLVGHEVSFDVAFLDRDAAAARAATIDRRASGDGHPPSVPARARAGARAHP